MERYLIIVPLAHVSPVRKYSQKEFKGILLIFFKLFIYDYHRLGCVIINGCVFFELLNGSPSGTEELVHVQPKWQQDHVSLRVTGHRMSVFAQPIFWMVNVRNGLICAKTVALCIYVGCLRGACKPCLLFLFRNLSVGAPCHTHTLVQWFQSQ